MKLALNIILCAVLISRSAHAAELNPGYTGDTTGIQQSDESKFRRGEVIFFISYPFTFLGSLAVYSIAGSGMSSLDSGIGQFSPSGAGFFGLVAATAAFFSFGIAMNDYQAIQADTRTQNGAVTEYLSFTTRF
ncbi:hypothetical protein [Turneriella parva]|uniref:hypothetical protein n=1 Tax=Turneriella parva TaxID=29510 RepID=UPI0002E3A739|nr:hypothetical protein [Turneriella parva]